MIHDNFENATNYSNFLNIFKSFSISSILKKAGFYKQKGLSSVKILMDILTAILISPTYYSYTKNYKSVTGESLSKSVLYRFLSAKNCSWRILLQEIVLKIYALILPLTSETREKCFIVDDSVFTKNSAKHTQNIAKIFDHSTHKFCKGFLFQPLAYTDGNSTLLLDFALMSSSQDKNCLNPVDKIDRRTHSGKRLIESRMHKPDVIIQMLSRALKVGFLATYVLMDSWYTTAPFISQIRDLGLHVIGMVKNAVHTQYIYNGDTYTLEGLRRIVLKSKSYHNPKYPNIVGCITVWTTITKDNPTSHKVKIVFVRKYKSDQYLAVLSTNTELSADEIIRIYGKRWNIEVMFHNLKHYLKLVSGIQAVTYDSIIAHVTCVSIAYNLMEYMHRCDVDERTFGEIFFECCKELEDLQYKDAIVRLLDTVEQYIKQLIDEGIIKKNCKKKALEMWNKYKEEWCDEVGWYVKDFIEKIKQERSTLNIAA